MARDPTRRARPVLLALLAFVLCVPLVAAVLFLPVMLLAGPHTDLLPGWLQPVVLVLGWAGVIGVPAWIARRVHRRCADVRPGAETGAHPGAEDDSELSATGRRR